nr:hypothetical protein CFP56_36676 [Quercus suber]
MPFPGISESPFRCCGLDSTGGYPESAEVVDLVPELDSVFRRGKDNLGSVEGGKAMNKPSSMIPPTKFLNVATPIRNKETGPGDFDDFDLHIQLVILEARFLSCLAINICWFSSPCTSHEGF